MFKLEFETGNAAFGEAEDSADREAEVGRILRDVAAKIAAGIYDAAAYDFNGNRVGVFSLTPN